MNRKVAGRMFVSIHALYRERPKNSTCWSQADGDGREARTLNLRRERAMS